MGVRLYVGNLAYETGEGGLKQLAQDGGLTVADVHIVTDRETGRSRGFAFVELADGDTLESAIETLDGASLDGRRIAVSEARPRQPRDGAPPDRRGPPGARPPRPGGSGGERGFSGNHRPQGRPPGGDGAGAREYRPAGAGPAGRGPANRGDWSPRGADPERSHRRPRFDGPTENRFPGDLPPPRDMAPPAFGPPAADLSPKEESRRRNKKKKEKDRTEDRDSRAREGDRGGRKRRGGGRHGGWDQGDDW